MKTYAAASSRLRTRFTLAEEPRGGLATVPQVVPGPQGDSDCLKSLLSFQDSQSINYEFFPSFPPKRISC